MRGSLLLASLKSKQIVEVRDYSSGLREDLRHSIKCDFEVGSLTLSDIRLAVISSDGCYIAVYALGEDVKLPAPQKLIRGSQACSIYDMVQFTTVGDTEYLIYSSDTMTTHFFQLQKQVLAQSSSNYFFSAILPSSLMMGRSCKRIYVCEEFGLQEGKVEPYICFRDVHSEMLVILFHSGWCLKYSVSVAKKLQEDESPIDLTLNLKFKLKDF